MNFLLTIAIPSSGRIATLNKNIKYLKNIILKNNLNYIIEILISDTAEHKNLHILSSEVNSFIKYIHSHNSGLDKNIHNLIINSTGKFIWLCQDHTKIIESSLLHIVSILKNNNNLKYIFASTKKNMNLIKLLKMIID